nr:MAG TPA: hypothetical protein [Caudoviricetes sp.]
MFIERLRYAGPRSANRIRRRRSRNDDLHLE